MNLSILTESPTILMELPSTPLNLMLENHLPDVSQLDHIPIIPLHITPTGEKELNPISTLSESLSYHKKEENSVNPLSSLKSTVKPYVLLKTMNPQVLQISKEDFNSLCQVISEFKELFL